MYVVCDLEGCAPLLAILFISIPTSRQSGMTVQTWRKAHCSISIGLLRGRVCAIIDGDRDCKAPAVRLASEGSFLNLNHANRYPRSAMLAIQNSRLAPLAILFI